MLGKHFLYLGIRLPNLPLLCPWFPPDCCLVSSKAIRDPIVKTMQSIRKRKKVNTHTKKNPKDGQKCIFKILYNMPEWLQMQFLPEHPYLTQGCQIYSKTNIHKKTVLIWMQTTYYWETSQDQSNKFNENFKNKNSIFKQREMFWLKIKKKITIILIFVCFARGWLHTTFDLLIFVLAFRKE